MFKRVRPTPGAAEAAPAGWATHVHVLPGLLEAETVRRRAASCIPGGLPDSRLRARTIIFSMTTKPRHARRLARALPSRLAVFHADPTAAISAHPQGDDSCRSH
jgi:hypothetical protein